MKRYQSEQNSIADMKDYIARFGHGRCVQVVVVIIDALIGSTFRVY